MDIGKTFKKIRLERGLSQRDLAKELSVTPVAIWKIENGRTLPKPDTIAKFCKLMQIPVAYLYNNSFSLDDYKAE